MLNAVGVVWHSVTTTSAFSKAQERDDLAEGGANSIMVSLQPLFLVIWPPPALPHLANCQDHTFRIVQL